MKDDNWATKYTDIIVDGPDPRGRPDKTWTSVINDDLKKKGPTKELCHNEKPGARQLVNRSNPCIME